MMARTLFATMSTLLFSLGLLQAAPINQDGLNAQEKEIAKLHDHVLPGLDEAAYRLKRELPLSSLGTITALHRMINPLLSMFDFKNSANANDTIYQVIETLIEDTCDWLGITTCQEDTIKEIKQKLDLQVTLNNQLYSLRSTYLRSLCPYINSLPTTYCTGYRDPAQWLEENHIL